METKEIGRWESNENTEIFFDKIFKHFIVRNGPQIELKPLGLSASFSLGMDKNSQLICQQKFSQLRVNAIRNIMSVLTDNGEFVILK